MKYDIIVVGSGLGGLAAACRLSVLGYKVGVFEQHYKAGGYASNFNRNGYEFDISLHGIPGLLEGGNLYQMLHCCKVFERITPLKYKDAYTVRLGDELIVIPNDIIEYKKMLLERYPKETEGIKRLFNDLGHFEEGFHRYMMNAKGHQGRWHKDCLLFIRWSNKTCYDVIHSYVKDEEFIRLFTAFWPNFGLPPKRLSAITFFISWVSYHYHGKYYVKGGAQSITNAFLSVLEEYGSEVHLNANVIEVLKDKRTVNGIQLASGEKHTADWIILNMSPKESLKMIKSPIFNHRYVRKITRSRVGCTLSQLYIGLDCLPEELGIPHEEIFSCCGKDHEEDYKLSLGNHYDESGYLLTNYSSMDVSMNDSKHGVITMTYIDNYTSWDLDQDEYIDRKQYVKDTMLKRLYHDYPKVSGHVVLAELATPKTMERRTKNTSGAVYGYQQNVRQTGSHRLHCNTGTKGLSFVGAWVNPGGGYEGTITGAIFEAQRIHSKLKRKDR